MPYFMVPRDAWKAQKPSVQAFDLRPFTPLQFLVLTYTNTPKCDDLDSCCEAMRQIQYKDMSEGLPDIKYNWLIGNDGNVYEGAGWYSAVYWADLRHNPHIYNSLTVAFINDIHTGTPTQQSYEALKNLVGISVKDQHLKFPVQTIKLFSSEDKDLEDDELYPPKKLTKPDKAP